MRNTAHKRTNQTKVTLVVEVPIQARAHEAEHYLLWNEVRNVLIETLTGTPVGQESGSHSHKTTP